MSQHRYGAIPDKVDVRDYLYRRTLRELPNSVDLRPLTSPVRDQGDLGSCTGFAISTGMREFIENATKEKYSTLSPLFLYFEERKLEGTISQDAGAEPRDGMKVLTSLGCAPEADDPYDISKFIKAPSSAAVKDALVYTAASYHRLSTLADVQDCLAGGSGFVIGFDVYDSFENIGSDGKMPMPKAGEELLGGHAVFVCGYKVDTTWPGGGYLIVKNSWGTAWGDAGFFYMPFAYVISTNPVYVSDMWVAVGKTPVPVPPAPPDPPVPPTPGPTPPAPGCLPQVIAFHESLLAWLKSIK